MTLLFPIKAFCDLEFLDDRFIDLLYYSGVVFDFVTIEIYFSIAYINFTIIILNFDFLFFYFEFQLFKFREKRVIVVLFKCYIIKVMADLILFARSNLAHLLGLIVQ